MSLTRTTRRTTTGLRLKEKRSGVIFSETLLRLSVNPSLIPQHLSEESVTQIHISIILLISVMTHSVHTEWKHAECVCVSHINPSVIQLMEDFNLTVLLIAPVEEQARVRYSMKVTPSL